MFFRAALHNLQHQESHLAPFLPNKIHVEPQTFLTPQTSWDHAGENLLTRMWIQRLQMHTFSCSYKYRERHSMFQTQFCRVWGGFLYRFICGSKQEWPSGGQHVQDLELRHPYIFIS